VPARSGLICLKFEGLRSALSPGNRFTIFSPIINSIPSHLRIELQLFAGGWVLGGSHVVVWLQCVVMYCSNTGFRTHLSGSVSNDI
jgi:hypothetical protein